MRSKWGYKIGKAKVVKNRQSQFGLALPFKVELIHALRTNDMNRCEWHFHNHFKAQRLNGEWFSLSDEDVAFFCDAGTDRGVGELFYVEPTPNLTPFKLAGGYV